MAYLQKLIHTFSYFDLHFYFLHLNQTSVTLCKFYIKYINQNATRHRASHLVWQDYLKKSFYAPELKNGILPMRQKTGQNQKRA